MNGTDVCIPFDEEGRYAHMKGTDVCISTEAHINEAWTDAHIDNIDEEWMEVCINGWRCVSIRRGCVSIGKYAHMKGTDVCVCINEEGTDARIIEEGVEACINKETTEAHINGELMNTHSDNIDKDDKKGRYAHMKEIYISSMRQEIYIHVAH